MIKSFAPELTNQRSTKYFFLYY